jgi:hypothetical protein
MLSYASSVASNYTWPTSRNKISIIVERQRVAGGDTFWQRDQSTSIRPRILRRVLHSAFYSADNGAIGDDNTYVACPSAISTLR